MKFKKILLIDDDKIANFINRKLITVWDIAENIDDELDARVALNKLEATTDQPDLILLDLNMPNFDGFDFMKAYNAFPEQRKNQTTIVILTSSNNINDINRVKELGFQRIINKPLTQDKLESALY